MSDGMPTIRKLGWISFWGDVASEMTYPVMPLFIVGTLKAPAWTIGVIEGVAALLISFLRLWSGLKSDTMQSRVGIVRWGYGLGAFAKPLVALAPSWGAVLALRLVDRTGKGIRTSARDAMIADHADPERPGYAFGFHRMMDSAGALVGVLFGLLLLWLFPENLRLILGLTLIPGVICLFVAFQVRDQQHREAKQGMPLAKWKDIPDKCRLAIVVSALFGIANSSDIYLLLHASEVGFAPIAVAACYAVYNLVFMASSTPFGKLSDLRGPLFALTIGWMVYSISYAGMSVATGALVVALFALYGIAIGATDGVSKAFISSYAPKDSRGAIMGWHYCTIGLTTLVGNLITGYLWTVVSSKAALGFCAASAMIAVVILLLTFGSERTSRG